MSYHLLFIVLIYLLLEKSSIANSIFSPTGEFPNDPVRLEHPLIQVLLDEIKGCGYNVTSCDQNKIFSISAKIANEHSALLLYDKAKSLFEDILYYIDRDSPVGAKFCHILSVMSFAQGDFEQVNNINSFKLKPSNFSRFLL